MPPKKVIAPIPTIPLSKPATRLAQLGSKQRQTFSSALVPKDYSPEGVKARREESLKTQTLGPVKPLTGSGRKETPFVQKKPTVLRGGGKGSQQAPASVE